MKASGVAVVVPAIPDDASGGDVIAAADAALRLAPGLHEMRTMQPHLRPALG